MAGKYKNLEKLSDMELTDPMGAAIFRDCNKAVLKIEEETKRVEENLPPSMPDGATKREQLERLQRLDPVGANIFHQANAVALYDEAVAATDPSGDAT